MIIKEITKSEYDKYTTLVNKCGSIFNSLKWLQLYSTRIKLLGIYNNDNTLIGSFYYFVFQKFGFEIVINPPFTPSIGLFFENNSLNKSNQLTFEKKVLELLSAHFKNHSAKLLEIALPAKFKDTQPFIWSKIKVNVRYTYHIDLSLSLDNLLNNLTSEKRKSLNKAQKDKLEVKRENNQETVKKLIEKTFKRKNKVFNSAILDKILFEFADESNSFSFVAYENDVPKACTFCIHDTDTAYYLIGGYDENEKHHGAGVTCMWQSIKYAQSLGLKTFDFEGSMLPEVEKYFREFGGDLIPFYEVVKSRFPLSIYKMIR